MKYIEKKFNLVVFSSHHFMNIHCHLSYHVLPTFLKLHVLKNNCLCNRDNAHDIDIFPDEKITKRSEPTNQAKTKANVAKGFKTYLNGSKNYLTTYQGFKICFVILKTLCKY